ncbi:preprotein translocase subunit SecG [Clostridium sp. JN-9]|uniref:preprotein translocase subunit SecG n=1 Tax=Clostridium sp. JN-9 TaxID=2507159 RepID=UPI000FFDFB28|nr:preprotein translocase subunit SecG [Clostridium sp. JN-9]QAT39075.1 preprotein translocase subunit SecG [Clostridium sp. JN-9]
MKTAIIVLQIIVSILLIAIVLVQPSKTDGLSGLMGGTSDTFFAKNKSRTSEAVLSKATVVLAIIFGALAMAQNIIK